MLYSIVVSTFEHPDVLRACLESLEAETAGNQDVQTILVPDEPCVAKAFNAGARSAHGRFLIFVKPNVRAHPGWLGALRAAAQDGAGAVGARVLAADGTIAHCGFVAYPAAMGFADVTFADDLRGLRADDVRGMARREVQAVSDALLLTPKAAFEETGGFDEAYCDGGEDIDYCLRVRARGMRVIVEPAASVTELPSMRRERVAEKAAMLAARLQGRVTIDCYDAAMTRGEIVRQMPIVSRKLPEWKASPVPPVRVIVYGESADCARPAGSALPANTTPVAEILQCAALDAVRFVRESMELRGDRYLAVVDARTALEPGWLDAMLKELTFDSRRGAVRAPGCTLLALRKFPGHHRLADGMSLEPALAEFLAQAWRLFGIATHGLAPSHGGDACALESALRTRAPQSRGLVSIVTLSWNAPQFTKLAIESIRAHTPQPYEIIVVDNGSRRETTDWLKTLDDVRVIFNAENRGFATGNNQGFAAARGERIVMLNNDVIVTEGWLEGLLAAFDRIPGLGVSAPRSNRVAGHQQLNDCAYADIPAMHAYAAQRRERLRGSGYLTERAIGLCLCIDRTVLDEVGGIDPRYAIGNFEDDDFCMRVRACGYKIYVCDDVFIHHFGSQSFAANNVDWSATMQANWEKFAQKWGYPEKVLGGSYDPSRAIVGGFDRSRHYVPLPVLETDAPEPELEIPKTYRVIFAASVEGEVDWNEVGTFVRKYLRTFSAGDEALLAIAAHGALDARSIGERVRRFVEKAGVARGCEADVEISDEPDLKAWLEQLPHAQVLAIGGSAIAERTDAPMLPDRSPSGMRRALAQAAAVTA